MIQIVNKNGLWHVYFDRQLMLVGKDLSRMLFVLSKMTEEIEKLVSENLK